MSIIKPFLIVANLLTGIMLILLSCAWFKISPLASVIILFASFDQFEDVYFLVTGRSLLKGILIGYDIGAEIAQFVMGIAILLFGVSYIDRLAYSMLPYATAFLGFIVCFSSLYDLASMSERHLIGRVKRVEVGIHEESIKRSRRRLLRDV